MVKMDEAREAVLQHILEEAQRLLDLSAESFDDFMGYLRHGDAVGPIELFQAGYIAGYEQRKREG
jgi:hypothetical protein